MTSKDISRRGFFMVLSSPSGAGKTTLTRQLREAFPELKLSISVTTRPMRPGEVDGVHYHFIDHAKFKSLVENKGLLEHATVFENSYGTPRELVEAELEAGIDI